jgi:hypothetical protein
VGFSGARWALGAFAGRIHIPTTGEDDAVDPLEDSIGFIVRG